MPEGDTLFRTAKTLGRVLKDQSIVRCRSQVDAVEPARVQGRRVRCVEARGKNLLIHLQADDSEDEVLYTHLRMNGSWHIYPQGERWRKPERQFRVVLETSEYVTVCFNAPVVEMMPVADLARHPVLSALGPDILSDSFDTDEAVRRIVARPELTIGEALMLQRAVAGIGNVYKSETLFVCKTNPHRRVGEFAEDAVGAILREARRLMLQNREGFPRVTRPRGRHWVYGLQGRPCFLCGERIRMQRQGNAGRSTYWCSRCQS